VARTRDAAAQQRILQATYELLSGQAGVSASIDTIAEAAGVGRQTIYRWWPSRTALVLDALVAATMEATPFPNSGDARRDFQTHLRAVVRLFRSPTATLVRAFLAEAQSDPSVAAEFVARFWVPRRALSKACLRRGVAAGAIRADVDEEIVLDALYGPLWTRLLIGHQPMAWRVADAILDTVWAGIATPTEP
jgi:AcrR family transcriptional regulator